MEDRQVDLLALPVIVKPWYFLDSVLITYLIFLITHTKPNIKTIYWVDNTFPLNNINYYNACVVLSGPHILCYSSTQVADTVECHCVLGTGVCMGSEKFI